MGEAAILVRVVAPHLCAGIAIDRQTGKCVEAAPILRWCVGRSASELRAYFDRQGWEAKRLPEPSK